MIDPQKGPVYAKDRSLFTVDGDEEVPTSDVITADGWNSTTTNLLTANGKMPGPTIILNQNQKVTITVKNKLMNEAVTVHWHGIDQLGWPAMDGVAYVTQCPISPGQSFDYTFQPRFGGTFWYHSHVGNQRDLGLFGALIVLREEDDITRQHVIQLQEWNHLYDPVAKLKANLKGSGDDQKSILINGRGEFKENGAPLEEFTIHRNQQHRFRLIHVGSGDTFSFSVPGLKLIIKETDGFKVDPKIVDQIIIYSAERYDFELDLQCMLESDTYEMIVKILTGSELTEKNDVKGVAIIKVTGTYQSPENSWKFSPFGRECHDSISKSDITLLNCPFENYPNQPLRKCVPVSNLVSTFTETTDMITGSSKQFFLNFAFVGGPSVNGRKFIWPTVSALTQNDEVDTNCDKCKDEGACACTYAITLPYESEIIMIFLNLGKGGSVHHPIHMHGHTFEVLKMEFPKIEKDPDTGKDKLIPTEDIRCSKDKPNAESDCNNAEWRDPSWNDYKIIPGINLNNAVRKDTLVVPVGGYAIIRIYATNPGVWFMHCHIDRHMMGGMAVMLYEALDQVKDLPDLPTCRSFRDDESTGNDGGIDETLRKKTEL